MNAVNYIDVTKQEGQPTEERIVPQLSESDRQKQQSRITIKGLLWVVGVAVVGLVGYVLWQLWQLMV